MLKRNGPVVKSVESVLRLEGSLWWERFVKEVGLEAGVKREGVMDGESGELAQWEDVVGAWTGRTEASEWMEKWDGPLSDSAGWHQEEHASHTKYAPITCQDQGSNQQYKHSISFLLEHGLSQCHACGTTKITSTRAALESCWSA